MQLYEETKSLREILDNAKGCRVLKKKKRGETLEYLDLVSSFDIETSSFYVDSESGDKEKRAIMYGYSFGIEGMAKIGRTWEEFMDDIREASSFLGVNYKRRLIVYVHNLPYEFQFIRKRFQWADVFAMDSREVVYAVTTDGIEFRCSEKLSNRSLAQVGENLVLHRIRKMEGDLDYSLPRNRLTPLTDKERRYMLHDVLVVMAYIDELRHTEGSLLYIPLTNTGFVRNHCRKETVGKKENKAYRSLMHRLTLDKETYLLCKMAFMGGFTHANALWSRGIEFGVDSYDETSAYPTVMCSEKFPMSKPYRINVKSREGLFNLMERFCVLMDVTFNDVDEKFTSDHYVSQSKCIEIEGEKTDNGRVVRAKKIRMVLTDIDFKIIDRTYCYESMTVNNCLIFRKEYLPKEFVSCILDFYEKKTTLKDVVGSESEYGKMKNMLNACYGMTVTDICRDEILYEDDDWIKSNGDVDSSLKAYNESHNRFLFYPWGIWVTAYARWNLWQAILELGDDYIYSDTDSVKELNYDRHVKWFEDYNSNVRRKIEVCLTTLGIDPKRACPKNSKGKEKPMGVWEHEGRFKEFKTLGAKRYIMVTEDDKLLLTVSGVAKKNGVRFLLDRYRTPHEAVRNFDDSLVFPASYEVEVNGKKETRDGCGKRTHTYIDDEKKGKLTDYLGNVADYDELSAIHLENTSYSMSLSEAYKSYLEGRRGNWQL